VCHIPHDDFGIIAITRFVGFNLFLKIMAFMLGMPVELINMGQSIACQAHAYFGPEFDFLALFAPDDWPDIRLADADDAIFTALATGFVHFMLLVVQMRQYPVTSQQPVG